MELFGIAFSIPAAFVASVVYSFVIRWLMAKLPWLKRPALGASVTVLAGLVLEWCLLGAVGVVRGREIIGPVFYPAHLAIFLFSIPALANLLVLARPAGRLGWCLVAGVLCAALDLPVVLTQYVVTEALYGVDGSGGPYGRQ